MHLYAYSGDKAYLRSIFYITANSKPTAILIQNCNKQRLFFENVLRRQVFTHLLQDDSSLSRAISIIFKITPHSLILLRYTCYQYHLSQMSIVRYQPGYYPKSIWTRIHLASWFLCYLPLSPYRLSGFYDWHISNIAAFKLRWSHQNCLCLWTFFTKPPNSSMHFHTTNTRPFPVQHSYHYLA